MGWSIYQSTYTSSGTDYWRLPVAEPVGIPSHNENFRSYCASLVNDFHIDLGIIRMKCVAYPADMKSINLARGFKGRIDTDHLSLAQIFQKLESFGISYKNWNLYPSSSLITCCLRVY